MQKKDRGVLRAAYRQTVEVVSSEIAVSGAALHHLDARSLKS